MMWDIQMLQSEKTPEAEGRLENLKKLITDLKNRNSIEEFFEEVGLLIESINEIDKSDKVSIMTHSAKGLEFDFVFLPGWEEGIFLQINEILMNMVIRVWRKRED